MYLSVLGQLADRLSVRRVKNFNVAIFSNTMDNVINVNVCIYEIEVPGAARRASLCRVLQRQILTQMKKVVDVMISVRLVS